MLRGDFILWKARLLEQHFPPALASLYALFFFKKGVCVCIYMFVMHVLPVLNGCFKSGRLSKGADVSDALIPSGVIIKAIVDCSRNVKKFWESLGIIALFSICI